jgi:hypothetical protein
MAYGRLPAEGQTQICFIRAPPLACKAASLIEKETLKKRISNIES